MVKISELTQRAMDRESKYTWIQGYDDSVVPTEFIGETILSVKMGEDSYSDAFIFEFDTHKLIMIDDGQSCCEHRYFTCDDDYEGLTGSELVSIEQVDYKENGDDYVHEESFIKVQTSTGFITIVSHNEHNGYYGGINRTFKVIAK